MGYWTNHETVQMGFNRLAILDLTAAGYQPMMSPEGRYIVVFNGEIYNHLALRDKLNFKNFKGHNDAETICACIDEWGIEKTVEQLDGMFAFVVFDQKSSVTTLVRDFAGIKPLFYGWNGTTLVAASQYDQVVRHPSFLHETVDVRVLRLYLQQHFMPAPYGLIRNTYQVEPGEIIQISHEGRLTKKKYWVFPNNVQADITEENRALETLHEALDLAVQQELLSDVPLGGFLSGGIDSPLICYYAKNHKDLFKTFTIGSDSTVHDETEKASVYAWLIGSTHFSVRMNAAGGKDLLNEVLSSMHEPMADFSLMPTYLVSRLARQQVTVALSGDGADELFFGYERFWSLAKNIRYQSWPWIVKAGLYKIDKWLTGNRRINGAVLLRSQAEAHQFLHSRFPVGKLYRLFPYLKSVPLPDSYVTYKYPLVTSEKDLIQYMRQAEFYGMMQKTLRKVDLASMENSLEVRVPFLKKSLIEASLKIDPFLSYGPYQKKVLLKKLLQKLIPYSPVDDIKRGFTIPLGYWLRKEMRDDIYDRVLNADFLASYDINRSEAEQLLADHQKGQDLKWPIFTLLALSAWQEKISA